MERRAYEGKEPTFMGSPMSQQHGSETIFAPF
jgi:hypothetical protein